ncbi:MAG: BMP family ABC transporter substrate-binding protein [Thaumarchaeota archaeon]|nr:BMP family ABC transporter substrate-binding protein [Nitrososphaerota archaeon]
MNVHSRNGISTTIGVSVIIVLLLAAAVAYYFISSTGTKTTTTPTTTTTAGPLPGKGMSIGVIFDVGGLGDRGFNDLAFQGMSQANTTLGVDTHYVVAASSNDYTSDFEAIIAKHVNLVVGVGFNMDPTIAQEAAKYPNQKFAQVDGDIYNLTNVIAIKFTEHTGSAIVGALSVAMTNTNKIAFLGGVPFSIIYKFWNGWKAGAVWASNYLHKNVTLLKQFDSTDFSVGFSDPAGGQRITQSFISQGADIVFMVAGGTGIGGLKAVGQYDIQQGWNFTSAKPPVFGIGVDANQDYYGTYGFFVKNSSTFSAPSFVLTSEIKKVDFGVFKVMQSVVYGNYSNYWNDAATFGGGYFSGSTTLCGTTGDQPCHVRNVLQLGLAQGAVGPTPFQYSSQYLTPAAKNILTQITRGILNGTIVIPENYNDSPT